MSENEIKENQNNNKSGGRRRHHRHHKNKNNRPNEQKNIATEQKNVAPQAQNQNQKKNNNQKNNRQNDVPRNDQKKNNQKNNRQEVSKTAELNESIFGTAPHDDAIFGNSLFSQPVKKEKPVSKEPLEFRELSDEELFGTEHILYTKKQDENATVEVVGVRFKPNGKVYYFDPNGIKFTKGKFAILETARGIEFGEICLANKLVRESDIVQPLQKVCRAAVKEDFDRHKMNKQKEKEAFKICLEKIVQHGLDMKLVDVQCAFDNSKLLFYFTSAGRVDFRELVRDLAAQFKTRIELRQIGIRDEAKLIGGIGICGRPLCCSRHLSNFAQVSIKMAKEQGLSLSSNKISGNCGRLMCCLNFENQTYIYEIKRTPMPGSKVKVGAQIGNVTDANPLTGMLKVHLNDAPDNETVSVHRDSVILISKKEREENAENDDVQE